MHVVRFPSAKVFLERYQSYLETDEAANNMLLGLVMRLLKYPEIEQKTLLFGVETDQKWEACGLHNAGHNVVINANAPASDEVGKVVADFLRANANDLTGIFGPSDVVPHFAKAYAAQVQQQAFLNMGNQLYVLHDLKPPAAPKGRLRLAMPGEDELIAEWWYAFALEIFPTPLTKAVATRQASDKIRSGEMYIWDDGKAVSMTGISRPTRNGITITHVYTPPELRGKGYATYGVAAVCERMLNKGYDFCTLYAEVGNPVSNRMYRNMGFEAKGIHEEWCFE